MTNASSGLSCQVDRGEPYVKWSPGATQCSTVQPWLDLAQKSCRPFNKYTGLLPIHTVHEDSMHDMQHLCGFYSLFWGCDVL
jgi:hypothetical protein